MIGNAKRRFFRFSLTAAMCILSAFALYDLQEVDTSSLAFAGVAVLMFIGVILFLFGFAALAFPDDYDRFEEEHPAGQYARMFYGIAIGLALTMLFLLIWIVAMGASNNQAQGMLAFGLLVIGGCWLIGRASQNV